MSSLDRISAIAGVSAVSPYATPTYSSSVSTGADTVRSGDRTSFSSVLDSVSKQSDSSSAVATADSSSGNSSGNSEQVKTVTEVMPDGSLLIKQMRGNEVISSQKIKVADMGQQDGAETAIRAYRASSYTGASAGLLFSTSI